MPVSLIASTPQVLVANPALPASSPAELLASAQSAGATPIAYGSADIGSPGHLAGELLRMKTQAKSTHVPYHGGGPATIAVLGGEIRCCGCRCPRARSRSRAATREANIKAQ